MKEILYTCPWCGKELGLRENRFFHDEIDVESCGIDIYQNGLKYSDVVCPICLHPLYFSLGLGTKICSNLDCESYSIKHCLRTEGLECSRCNRKLVRLGHLSMNFQYFCIFPINHAKSKECVEKALDKELILKELRKIYG